MKKILTLIIISLLLKTYAYSLTLNGTVYIERTTIPISNATITLTSSTNYISTKTNTKGTFSLTTTQNIYTLVASANNYITQSIPITITTNQTITIYCPFKTSIKAPKQHVIADKSEGNISFYNIENKTISRLAEATMFSDTMNSLKILPGVASLGTFDAQIYIRGGNSYEIIGILDNIPIYDPYLWGGRISIFNSKIAKKVDFYPGGFHAKGGQSLSGILDYHTKDGNFKEKQTELDINITELNLYHTAPIKQNKSNYMISYKRTYYDLFAPLFISSESGKVQMPYLQSFQSKYTQKLSNNDTLKTGLYFFNDGLNIPFDVISEDNDDGYFKYDIKQFILSSTYVKNISKTKINETNIAFFKRYGDYDINNTDSNITNTYHLDHTNLIFRNDLSWDINNNHHVEIGGIFYRSKLSDDINFTLPPDPTEENTVTRNLVGGIHEPAIISGLYIQDTWQLTKKVSLRYGLRLEHTKFTSYNWNTRLDPRLSLTYKLNTNTTLKTYYGTYSQQLFESNQISNASIIESGDYINFVAADTNMEIAKHYGLGIEHNLSTSKIIKSEVFYKQYDNLLVNSDETGQLIYYANNGKGYSEGIELAFQKLASKKGEGWFTYTFSKTKRKDKDGWYTPTFDLTHMINIYADYAIKPKTHLITTIKYNTGSLYTPIYSSYTNQTTGATEYVMGETNSKRFNDYLRIDFWVEYDKVEFLLPIPFLPIGHKKTLNIFPTWEFNGSTRIGIYNILNTKNAIEYYWNKTENKEEFVYDMPIMLIYGYNIKF